MLEKDTLLPDGYHPMMRNVPESERPRERMLNSGASSLSNAELIAILLRTGSSRESVLSLAFRLLNEVGQLRGLKSISYEELTAIKGIGPAKALLLIAGLELGKRISGEAVSVRPAVRSPQDVADVMMEEMRFLTQELCLLIPKYEKSAHWKNDSFYR
jgi:DNA repair protein RadC